jgi:hypothetical protein
LLFQQVDAYPTKIDIKVWKVQGLYATSSSVYTESLLCISVSFRHIVQ